MGFLRNLFIGKQDLLMKTAEESMAFEGALHLMELEFPKKFPKSPREFTGKVHKDTIEIVANLKIKEDEIYEKEIIINDKPKKYKIILKKGSVEDYEKSNSGT